MSVGDTGIDYTGSPLFADSRDARAAPLVLRGDVPSAAALGARLAALEAANDSGEEEGEASEAKEGAFVLHRKLKALWPLMDGRDYAGGHGSHVSGTVAGAIDETIDPTAAAAAAGGGGDATTARLLADYGGMARGAGLIFADLTCNAGDAGCNCSALPSDGGDGGGDGEELPWCPCGAYPGGVCPDRRGVDRTPRAPANESGPLFLSRLGAHRRG